MRKAEDNRLNTFLADEDKIPDQVVATLVIDGEEFNGLGDDEESAVLDLREKVDGYYNAKKHTANNEINKAIGLYFFD